MKNKFEFDTKNLKLSKEYMSQYPKGKQQSAVISLLDMAQRQNEGHITKEIIEYVADMLATAPMKVYEVASFYTMLNLKPVGKYHIQVCGTTPCWLRGSHKIMKACETTLKIKSGETTKNKQFTLTEVECLGACVNAPMVQINDDYYEDLDPKIMKEIISKLKKGEKVKIGSQIGRQTSAAFTKKEAIDAK
jgi:NADH-quinone oxidoreductase E subunit